MRSRCARNDSGNFTQRDARAFSIDQLCSLFLTDIFFVSNLVINDVMLMMLLRIRYEARGPLSDPVVCYIKMADAMRDRTSLQ